MKISIILYKSKTLADGSHPLMISMEKPKCLVESGADVNAKDNDGLTPVYLAILKGHVGVARWLVELGADVHANLHTALQEGNFIELAKQLLALGAVVNTEGDLTLNASAFLGDLELDKEPVVLGADIRIRGVGCLYPLHDAAREGHTEAAELFIILGADVNAKDKSGFTPLHRAALLGHLEVVKLLLEKGANASVKNLYF